MVPSVSRSALRETSLEEIGMTCRTTTCSKLCKHLSYDASRSRTKSPTQVTSKPVLNNSGHEKESISQNPSRCAHPKEEETIQSKCTSDETPFLLDSPDITSGSAYATPCGKEYSFVLSGTALDTEGQLGGGVTDAAVRGGGYDH